MAEHRVSMPTLRRYEDPENSRDPRVQAVLTQLKSVQIAPEPRAHFRAELRAQLVAVAPRIIAEGAAEHAAQLAKTGRTAGAVKAGAAESRRGFSFARPLAVAATVACAFLALLGGAVWMSQKSLPGDALYGLKRASENVRLSMATSDADKAKEYLDLAATRVAEANDLAGHTSALGTGTLAGGMSASTARLISGNLTSANSDVASASTLLGTDAVKSHSANPLATLTSWAPGQQQRLQSLAAAVSNPAVRKQALESAGFVRAAAVRATTLEGRIGSSCLAKSPKDSLGPKPCVDPAGHPAPTAGRTTSKPAPHPTVPNGTHARSTTPRPAGTTGGSVSTSPLLPISTPTTPKLPLPLPSLPVKLPLPTGTGGPISTTSCSVTVLGIRIGCPSSSAP